MYQSLAVVATACSQYGARAFSISGIDTNLRMTAFH
jgi:hypothetical protein